MGETKLNLRKGVLFVNGMKFYAYHGCLEEETKIGGEYEVDIEIDGDFSKSVSEDDLRNTYDYTDIYNVVKKEMSTPSKLIEHVAGRIAESLNKQLKGLKSVGVIVKKINPPVNGNIANSKIKLVYDLS